MAVFFMPMLYKMPFSGMFNIIELHKWKKTF